MRPLQLSPMPFVNHASGVLPVEVVKQRRDSQVAQGLAAAMEYQSAGAPY